MPPRKNGSDGGSDQRGPRSRPVTPARHITQTVPAATTGRRTRGGNSAPLEDMVDDPDRILRGTRTPSRRLSVASNESRASARAARPSVAASFNADLSAIGEEGDEENILDNADIPLPSTEDPQWTEQDTDLFGAEVPSPRGEAGRSVSSSHDSFESSIHSNRSSPPRNRGTTPDRGNAAGRRRSGERVDAPGDEDLNDDDSMLGDRGPVRQASANPLILLEERGQAPNPDEPDDPGAEGDQLWDRIPWLWRLLSIFWEQFGEAMRYFKQARFHVSFGLAVKLLASVVCSAGPICDERSGYELILRYLRSATWECFCSLGVYTLIISGLIDSFEAIGRTLSDTGIRAAQQEEPLFNGWKGVLRHPMAYINEYLAPICRDVANKVLEPVMMLWLTISLRSCSWLTFGKGTNTSDVVLTFIICFTLHLLKWICQTLEIFYDLPGNMPGLRWAKRPLVSLLLLMLSVWAICYNWDVLSPSPTSTVRVVKAYWNSDQYPRTGNETTLSIASWISQSTKEAATQVYRVTQVLVTGGVVPTMSGVS